MTATRTTLTIQPLTAEAFRPFGDVIEARDTAPHFTINQGFAERYHDLAHIDTAGEGGHAIVSLFKALPRDFPMAIEQMERHPLGSQAFVALAPAPFLVVVASPGAAPGPQDLRCFLAQAGQGVNYARGTWHHPLIALDVPGDFLVIDRGGPAVPGNCEAVELEKGVVWVERPRPEVPRRDSGMPLTPAQVVDEFLRLIMLPDPVAASRWASPGLRIRFTGGRAMSDPAECTAFNATRYRWVKKRIECTETVAGGTDAGTVVYSIGTLHGEWPDGTPFEGNRYVDRYVVSHGLITQMEVWNDSAEWLMVRAGLATW
jgi:ureidoglycolate lyase